MRRNEYVRDPRQLGMVPQDDPNYYRPDCIHPNETLPIMNLGTEFPIHQVTKVVLGEVYHPGQFYIQLKKSRDSFARMTQKMTLLHRQFMTLPIQAIRCRAHFLTPVGEHWIPGAGSRICDVFSGAKCYAYASSIDYYTNVVGVVLYKKEHITRRHVFLDDIMVAEGYARFTNARDIPEEAFDEDDVYPARREAGRRAPNLQVPPPIPPLPRGWRRDQAIPNRIPTVDRPAAAQRRNYSNLVNSIPTIPIPMQLPPPLRLIPVPREVPNPNPSVQRPQCVLPDCQFCSNEAYDVEEAAAAGGNDTSENQYRFPDYNRDSSNQRMQPAHIDEASIQDEDDHQDIVRPVYREPERNRQNDQPRADIIPKEEVFERETSQSSPESLSLPVIQEENSEDEETEPQPERVKKRTSFFGSKRRPTLKRKKVAFSNDGQQASNLPVIPEESTTEGETTDDN